jgi:hypothetical protein
MIKCRKTKLTTAKRERVVALAVEGEGEEVGGCSGEEGDSVVEDEGGDEGEEERTQEYLLEKEVTAEA